MDPYVRDRWRRSHYRGHGGLIGGIILAGIGVLLLLQNLGIPYFEDLERYWPLILIAVGIAQASRAIAIGGRVWGGTVVLVGAVFLLYNFGMIHGNIWRFLWPGILILIGLGMLARALDRQSYGAYQSGASSGAGSGATADHAKKFAENLRDRIVSDIPTGDKIAGDIRARWTYSPNHISEWAIFGGTRRRVDSQDFQGGEAFAMFGGVEIDLRKAATTRQEILIEINAVFGGVEVRVPETWNITVRGSGIFGGYEDETMDNRMTPDANQPRLIVNGFAVFGGVTVKN